MTTSRSSSLAETQRKAREIREAYERGEINDDERMERLRDLTEPKGFWAKLSWRLLGF
jgi:uncharacterized membrane protein